MQRRLVALAMVAAASVSLSVILAAPPVAASTATTASELPALLAQAAETTSPAYDRDRFEHWIDADSDGCNTRYEVLIDESTTPVTVGAGCSLTGGTWVSPYDGVTATTPAGIEIDHVVALAEAWPRTLTRSELVQRLWGDDPPQSDPLRSHLYLLRQVLDKPFPLAMLRTVHGVGFKLEADT